MQRKSISTKLPDESQPLLDKIHASLSSKVIRPKSEMQTISLYMNLLLLPDEVLLIILNYLPPESLLIFCGINQATRAIGKGLTLNRLYHPNLQTQKFIQNKKDDIALYQKVNKTFPNKLKPSDFENTTIYELNIVYAKDRMASYFNNLNNTMVELDKKTCQELKKLDDEKNRPVSSFENSLQCLPTILCCSGTGMGSAYGVQALMVARDITWTNQCLGVFAASLGGGCVGCAIGFTCMGCTAIMCHEAIRNNSFNNKSKEIEINYNKERSLYVAKVPKILSFLAALTPPPETAQPDRAPPTPMRMLS